MKFFSRTITFLLCVSFLCAAPFSASAAAGLSFGGRIVLIMPCISYLGPSVWVTITPAPATKQPFYIWTIATLRGIPPPGLPPLAPPISTPDPFPYAPLQEILGVADIPYFCCIPPSLPVAGNVCMIPAYPFWIPVPGLPGQRMQWANQSLLPSPPGVVLAAAAAAQAKAAAVAAASTGLSAASVVAIIAAATALVAGTLFMSKH